MSIFRGLCTPQFINAMLVPMMRGLGLRGFRHQGLQNLTRPFAIRSFHANTQALNYYRPPRNSIYETGPLSRVWNRMPDGIKLVGLIGVSGYLFIYVAVPILTLVVPPLVLGTIGLYQLNKFKRNRSNKQRWEMIKDSTLQFNPIHSNKVLPPPEQINGEIANFEINRIIDAFWANEQGIADRFDVDIDNLALGSLDALEFNYNSNSVLFKDDFRLMAIQQRPLYDKSKNKEIATVIMSLQMLDMPKYSDGIADPTLNIGRSKVLIELKPTTLLGRSVFLKTGSISSDSDAGDYIDVKGKTRTL